MNYPLPSYLAQAKRYCFGEYRFETLPNGVSTHGGMAINKADTESSIVLSDYCAFLVLLKGRVAFSLGAQHYEFNAFEHGVCVLIRICEEELLTRYLVTGESSTKIIMRGFDAWYPNLPKKTQVLAQPVTDLIHAQSNLWLTAKPDNHPMTKELHAFALFNACYEAHTDPDAAREPESSNHQAAKGRITSAQLTAHYQVNLEQKITNIVRSGVFQVDSLARIMGMSARSLQRKTQQALGLSVRAVLTNIKMQMAVEYLQERSLSVSEVAWLLGYAHPSNFIEAFKRYYKQTPAVYVRANTPTSSA